MIPPSRDILEFFQLLNSKKVEYLVIGGWAVSYYSRPRYTKDIDIFVGISEANATRLIDVLNDFGFGSLDIKMDDFLKPNYVVRLGFEPNQIDILTGIPGITFEEAWKDRQTVKFQGINFLFIGREALIKNKLVTGREQDMLDAKKLLKKTSPR